MKKGFTMIELVFVIVILGILASIAVPRLAATGDDAKAVKAAAEIKDVITQLAAKYTIDGEWSTIIGGEKTGAGVAITGLSADNLNDVPTMKAVVGRTKTDGNQWAATCVKITVSNKDGNIKIENGTDTASSYCQAIQNTPAMLDWKKLNEDGGEGIKVGGSGIFK
ncbi:hypothetical type II secretion system protein [Campylobacter iguaniorum]|uniref:Hypothetical type II secretion system protein n=1 Tax=Campylobacter iguaniorum TaxID=1244531 RepID=A0A076F9T4_9BACT|nr:type II secretion system protein [Campylobacter iguaniorum]AII14257.1 hypothetical type II secretion system protein [Campylobacter iguaniorum]